MSKLKNTEEEKKKLRDSAKAELERLEAIYSNEGVTQLLNDFKGKYNLCESVYKIILVRYLQAKGKKTGKRLVVDGRQVDAVLKFAGYGFDKAFSKKTFLAKNLQMEKQSRNSVMRLRTALTARQFRKSQTGKQNCLVIWTLSFPRYVQLPNQLHVSTIT